MTSCNVIYHKLLELIGQHILDVNYCSKNMAQVELSEDKVTRVCFILRNNGYTDFKLFPPPEGEVGFWIVQFTQVSYVS